MFSRRAWLASSIGLAATARFAAAQPQDRAHAAAEALLAAMGGRDRWRSATGIHVAATHWELPRAEPHANQIWNDFTQPRVRLEARSSMIDSVRVVTASGGWTRRDGALSALTPEAHGDELRWWESNIYRTMRRLALRDPDLTPRLAADGRLELVRPDGVRLNWFVLNKANQPIRFGAFDNEEGSIFGPPGESDGVRYAKWGTNRTGSWRYEINRVTLNPALTDELFEKP